MICEKFRSMKGVTAMIDNVIPIEAIIHPETFYTSKPVQGKIRYLDTFAEYFMMYLQLSKANLFSINWQPCRVFDDVARATKNYPLSYQMATLFGPTGLRMPCNT